MDTEKIADQLASGIVDMVMIINDARKEEVPYIFLSLRRLIRRQALDAVPDTSEIWHKYCHSASFLAADRLMRHAVWFEELDACHAGLSVPNDTFVIHRRAD